eukprot:scaffold145460_cov127-Phaeocystis_antarctica.AAC.1
MQNFRSDEPSCRLRRCTKRHQRLREARARRESASAAAPLTCGLPHEEPHVCVCLIACLRLGNSKPTFRRRASKAP